MKPSFDSWDDSWAQDALMTSAAGSKASAFPPGGGLTPGGCLRPSLSSTGATDIGKGKGRLLKGCGKEDLPRPFSAYGKGGCGKDSVADTWGGDSWGGGSSWDEPSWGSGGWKGGGNDWRTDSWKGDWKGGGKGESGGYDSYKGSKGGWGKDGGNDKGASSWNSGSDFPAPMTGFGGKGGLDGGSKGGIVPGANKFTPAPRLVPGCKGALGGKGGPNIVAPPGGGQYGGKGGKAAMYSGGGRSPVPPPPSHQPLALGNAPPPPGAGALQLTARLPPPLPIVPAGTASLVVPPPRGALAPDLAAMLAVPEVDDGPAEGKVRFPSMAEKKPRITLLILRLAADLQDAHMQRILEQCGDVLAWRRGREESGEPLAFGFVQFGDAESAWKASICMAGLKLCGSELKVLVEEAAETQIAKWRSSQQVALKVSNEEELAWELERKTVSCRSQIDAKVAELYGADDESGGAYAAQRKQELRQREQSRAERAQKRKAWREVEYAKELETVESAEKRMRVSEREKDDGDREAEEEEIKAKGEAAKADADGKGLDAKVVRLADDQKLCEMVDRVQSESRSDLFKMCLDPSFLSQEKVFDNKLRPWLEQKVDLYMGGPQTDLVEYIMRRVHSAPHPEALTSELTRYLDEGAEDLVERTWRMLAFELMRGGFVMQEPPRKAIKA